MAGEGAKESASNRRLTIHMIPSELDAADRNNGLSFPVPEHATAKGIEKLACAYSEVVYGTSDSTLELYCRLVRRGEEGQQGTAADPPTPLSQLVRMVGTTPQQDAPVAHRQGPTPERQRLHSTTPLFAPTPQQMELNATPPSAQPNQDRLQRVQQRHNAGGSLQSRSGSPQPSLQFTQPQTQHHFVQNPLYMTQPSHGTYQPSQESINLSQNTQPSQATIQVEHTQSQGNSNDVRKRARTNDDDFEFDHISDYESADDAPPRPVKRRKLPNAFESMGTQFTGTPASSSVVKRTNSNNAWTPEEDENLARGLRAGLAVAEIAAKYGINRSYSAMRNRKRELLKNDFTIPETQVSARRRQQPNTRQTQSKACPFQPPPATSTQSSEAARKSSMRQTFFQRDKGKGRAGGAPSSSLRLVSDTGSNSSPAVVISAALSTAGSIADTPVIDLTENTQQSRPRSTPGTGQSSSSRDSINTFQSSQSHREATPPARSKVNHAQEESETQQTFAEAVSVTTPTQYRQRSPCIERQTGPSGKVVVDKPQQPCSPSKAGPASWPQRQENTRTTERTECGSPTMVELATNQRAGGSDSETPKPALKPSPFEKVVGVKQSTSPEEWPDFSVSGPKRNMLTVGVLPYTSEVHVEIFEHHTDEYMFKDAIRVAKKESRLHDSQEIFDFAKLHMRMWYAVAAQDWEENKRLQARCRRMYRESRRRNGFPPGPRVMKTDTVEIEGDDGEIVVEERTWSQTASNVGDWEDMMAEMRKIYEGDSSERESDSDRDDIGMHDVLIDGPGRILGEEVQDNNDIPAGDTSPDDYDFASEQLLREAEQHEAEQRAYASPDRFNAFGDDPAELPTLPPGPATDNIDDRIDDAEFLRLVASDAGVDVFDTFDEDDNFVGRMPGNPTGRESPVVCGTLIAESELGQDEARLKELRKVRRKQKKLEKKSARDESLAPPSDAPSEATSVSSFLASEQSHRRRRHRRSGESRSGGWMTESDALGPVRIVKEQAQQGMEMPPPAPPSLASGRDKNERSKVRRKYANAASSRTERRHHVAAAKPTAGPSTPDAPAATSPASEAAERAKSMPPPPVPSQRTNKLVSILGTFNLGNWSADRPIESRVADQPQPDALPFDNATSQTGTTRSSDSPSEH